MNKLIDSLDFAFNRSFNSKETLINHGRKVVSLVHSRVGGKVVCNSYPKSGTHLINNVFTECASCRKSGYFFAEYQRNKNIKSFSDYSHVLKSIKNGHVSGAHMPHSANNATVLSDLGYKHVLLMRDPRDVILSQYFHSISRPTNLAYKVLKQQNDRLDCFKKLIEGFDSHGNNENTSECIAVPPFRNHYQSYLDWASEDCIVLRYEDLVGEFGGGSRENQLEAINQLLLYLGEPAIQKEQQHQIATRLYDRSSNTFRKGKVSGWVETLNTIEADFLNEKLSGLGKNIGYNIC